MIKKLCLIAVIFGLFSAQSLQAGDFCRIGEVSMVIDAPASFVYETTVDVASYPEWNPFILKVEPEGVDITVPGAEFILFTDLQAGSFAEAPQETIFSAPPTGDQPGQLKYAYRGVGYEYLMSERVQIFTPLDETTTLYESSEQFCGFLSLFIPFRQVKDGYDRQMAALAEESVRRYELSQSGE